MLPGNRWALSTTRWPLRLSRRTRERTVRRKRPGKSASNTVVLFLMARTRLSGGATGEEPASWNIEEGALVIRHGAGAIPKTGGSLGIRLHPGWLPLCPPVVQDQGRGPRFRRRDVLRPLHRQVLDCFNNIDLYADGHATANIGQSAHLLVNASRRARRRVAELRRWLFSGPLVQGR